MFSAAKWLDLARGWAYLRTVDAGGHSSQDSQTGVHSAASRRRRPPNPTEHAKRVAWGKKWGAIMSQHAKGYKKQGG